MRMDWQGLRPFRPVVFLGAAVVLLALSSMLLLAAVGLGFAAGETAFNPNWRPEDKAHMDHAADLACGLFVVAELILACVVVKSGLLKSRLRWTLRAASTMVIGSVVSYVIVLALLAGGHLPRPLEELEHGLMSWIQNRV